LWTLVAAVVEGLDVAGRDGGATRVENGEHRHHRLRADPAPGDRKSAAHEPVGAVEILGELGEQPPG
jgi:hypothetical protein